MNYAGEIRRLREKADECRADAQRFIGEDHKRLMVRLAEAFDDIADTYTYLEGKP